MFVAESGPASSVQVEPWPESGTVSTDEVAIIGHQGWAFLLNGSNNYYQAYRPSPTDKARAQAWQDYVTQTRSDLAAHGIDFAFAVVPNKATLLPHFYPLPTGGGPTCRMAHLLPGLEARDRLTFDRFLTNEAKETVFRRNDSHFTEYGSLLLADAIINLSGEHTAWSHYDFTATNRSIHLGDLGHRFTPPASETLIRLRHPVSDVVATSLDHPSRSGNFVGLSYSTVNPNAPIDRFILIFGNSFIERFPSWGASMPLVATMRKIHFVWLPAVDLDLAIRLKPDLVLLQTCERFLDRDPQPYIKLPIAANDSSTPLTPALIGLPTRNRCPPPTPNRWHSTRKGKCLETFAQLFFRLEAPFSEPVDVLCGKHLSRGSSQVL